jgi:hypothetical protein
LLLVGAYAHMKSVLSENGPVAVPFQISHSALISVSPLNLGRFLVDVGLFLVLRVAS